MKKENKFILYMKAIGRWFYKLVKFILRHWKIMLIIALVFGIGGIKLGLDVREYKHVEALNIGLRDIGEIATQVATIREVSTLDESRTLWGIEIPFTNSKQIYSYQVLVKAGYNFQDLQLSRNKATKKIIVTLPKVKVLSTEIVDDSLEVYYESESIFKPIKLKESNEMRKKMKDKAVQTAIHSKLYEDAKNNAQRLIEEFLLKDSINKEYQVEFK